MLHLDLLLISHSGQGIGALKEAAMILVRDVFQVKYGRGGELFKEAYQIWAEYAGRILTDASGPSSRSLQRRRSRA